METFIITKPYMPTELVDFRRRTGETGMELMLKESIRVKLLLDNKRKEDERIYNSWVTTIYAIFVHGKYDNR